MTGVVASRGGKAHKNNIVKIDFFLIISEYNKTELKNLFDVSKIIAITVLVFLSE